MSDCEMRCEGQSAATFVAVQFDPSRFDALASDSETRTQKRPQLPATCGFQDEFLMAAARCLVAEMESPSDNGAVYADSVAYSAAMHLLKLLSSAPRARRQGLSKAALKRVCELIENSIETGVSLAELASVASLSRTHFAKAFRKSTGTSPHRYLTRCRIELAKALLSESSA